MLKRIIISILTLILTISFSNISTFASDNICNHENIYETLKEPYSCEYGDLENTICVYCKDCGKLIEEKETLTKDMHGKFTYLDNNQIKCKICGRLLNENIRFKNGLITKEELPQYKSILFKVKEELYPNIDSKRKSYKKWLEDIESGIDKTDDDYFLKTCYLTGVIKKLEPLDLSKLDSNLNCKGNHQHLILFLKLDKNLEKSDAKLILNYKCMDCNYDEYITYDKSKIDTLEKRKELAKSNIALETFFDEAGLLKESFLDKIINFFKQLFN